MALRDALAHAGRLGCRVECVNRTGEVRVRPPMGRRDVAQCVTLNARRKDTARALVVLLRQLEAT